MQKLRAPIAPKLLPGARRLEWILPFLAACSVYDPSLLGDDRNSLTDSGGSSSLGGQSTLRGGSENGDEGGKSSFGGSTANGGEEEGGAGSPASNGGASTTGGGSTAEGGGETGGSASIGGAATTTGGSTATGGKSSTTGGASSTSSGGVATTGGTQSKGGTSSTGGATTGGNSSKGGTTSNGGTTGGGAGGSGGDGCPSDPNKTAPGVCGCGVPDQDSGSVAGCVGLRSALVHRYKFAGTGTTVSDSAGTAHGTAVNASVASGSITLAGGTPEQYVDLPNKILSPLTNATIEVWTTWSGGEVWQRVFDFGSSTSSTEGTRDVGETYLFLTPKTTSGFLKATFSASGPSGDVSAIASAALPAGVMSHLSVVVNDSADQLILYLNGVSVGSNSSFTGHLSGLNDINNWLGRSQFSFDVGYKGALHELRIYDVALSAAQIQLTEQTGPDPAFL